MTMDSPVAVTSDISEYEHAFPMRHGSTSAFVPDQGSDQPTLFLSYSREFSTLPSEWSDLVSLIDQRIRSDAEIDVSTVNEPSERYSWSFAKPMASLEAYRGFPVGISDELSSTLTGSHHGEGRFGVWSSLLDEFADKKKQAREAYQAYAHRIEELRSDAELDGFSVNEPSERDFWSFAKSVHSVRKAELVLVDNGNLRAVWDGEDGSHLGLQLLGDHMLQYVIFRRRKGSRHLSRVAGCDTFEGVKRQVRTFELEALLEV